MSETDPAQETIPEQEVTWLRRFFWMRGVSADETDFALRVCPALIAGDRSHETIRRAAMTILNTLNELRSRRNWLLNQARRWTQSDDEAADFAQTVITNALQNPASYRIIGRWNAPEASSLPAQETQIETWLLLLLKRCRIDAWRRAKPELSLDAPQASGIPLGELLPSPDTTEHLTLIDIMRFFAAAEATPKDYALGKRDLRIARLYWFQENTLEEIARSEGVAVSTAFNAAKRVREQLRRWLELPAEGPAGEERPKKI